MEGISLEQRQIRGLLSYMQLFKLPNNYTGALPYLVNFAAEYYPSFTWDMSQHPKEQVRSINEVVQQNFDTFKEWVKVQAPPHTDEMAALLFDYIQVDDLKDLWPFGYKRYRILEEMPAHGDTFVDIRRVYDEGYKPKNFYALPFYVSFKRRDDFRFLRKAVLVNSHHIILK